MSNKDSILLNITSGGNDINGSSHDFNINFSNLGLIHDANTKHEIALISYSLWYSWYNVSVALANNLFKYYNGTTNRTLTIPNGQYGVSDLNSLIKNLILGQGDDPDAITISGNYNTLKVDIIITGSYTVTFDGTGLDRLLGFNSGTLTAGTSSSDVQPDITNGIDAVQIHTSLISPKSNLINNTQSTCLHQFTPQSGPGSNLSATIAYPIYLPMSNSGNVHFSSFSIKDNLGRTLDLNGEQTSFVFHIRSMN